MIDDRYKNSIILRGPGLPLNVPVLADERPDLNDSGGFDGMSQRWYLRSAVHSTVESALTAYFPKGASMGGTMWVSHATGRRIAHHLFELEVSGRGRIGGQRYHRQVDAVVQQSSGENIAISVPPGYPFSYPGIAERVRSNEAALVAYTRYVTTTAPDFTPVSNTANIAGNPLPGGYPALPAPPVNRWSGLAEPTWIVPAGWVLEARRPEAILNTAGAEVCWYVEDVHTYYHHVRPGGG